LDLVILESAADDDNFPTSDGDWDRRLLMRIHTRLVRGGRLLIELPISPNFAKALDRFSQASGSPDWTGHRLHVRGETGEYQALLFGRDISALIERNRKGSELEVSLEALRQPIVTDN
jgi:hypothetical protein